MVAVAACATLWPAFAPMRLLCMSVWLSLRLPARPCHCCTCTLARQEPLLAHPDLVHRLCIADTAAGAAAAGSRGYYLLGEGVRLNQVRCVAQDPGGCKVSKQVARQKRDHLGLERVGGSSDQARRPGRWGPDQVDLEGAMEGSTRWSHPTELPSQRSSGAGCKPWWLMYCAFSVCLTCSGRGGSNTPPCYEGNGNQLNAGPAAVFMPTLMGGRGQQWAVWGLLSSSLCFAVRSRCLACAFADDRYFLLNES